MSGYTGVKRLAKEHPDWLPIVETCFEFSREEGEFAGSWVLEKANKWRPGLKVLVRYGVLKHEGTTRAGRRAYYTMPDREGVGRALRELGYLSERVS